MVLFWKSGINKEIFMNPFVIGIGILAGILSLTIIAFVFYCLVRVIDDDKYFRHRGKYNYHRYNNKRK